MMPKTTSPNEAEDVSWPSFPWPRFLGPIEILQILEASAMGIPDANRSLSQADLREEVVVSLYPIELGLHTLLARINHEGQTTKGQDELS
jgi:hypothetical protein